ncbi:MAG: hypothetical protein ACK443_09100 [Methylococcaceae bacterium]|jgi:hypothetical protein
MEQFNQAITGVFGVLLFAAIGFEVSQRRKKLRELYNLLDAQDRRVVAELDHMLASGQLQRYERS